MEDIKATVKQKHFWCYRCSHYYLSVDFSEPEHTGLDIDPGSPDDELNYYSRCPHCNEWVKAVPHYYANLKRMAANATGPKSDSGKRRVALNGFKHGIYTSEKHLLAPANGKYDICPTCDYQVQCKHREFSYCPFKMDLFLKVITAYENKDLGAMKQYAGQSQAKLLVIYEGMLAEVLNKHGGVIRQPKISNGQVVKIKDQTTGREEIVYEIVEHPLLKHIPKISAALGFTSDQQEMNDHVSMDKDTDLEGAMGGKVEPSGFVKEMTELIKTIQNGGAVKAAELARANDPVHKATMEDDEDGDVAPAGPDENPFR